MRLISSVRGMQRLAGEWVRRGITVGFVPTMGFLHPGHTRLMERARQWVGTKGVVVASIFVNPTQFGPNEDFGKYPRDLARDKSLCREAGVDALFVPSAQEMYPESAGVRFSTFVEEEVLSREMEGRSRPTHFRGVTTVVAKLFNIVRPTVAVFGAKDFQQAKVVEKMVRDLNFPVKIVVAPTVREADGLALSSRNTYLSANERRQATALWRAIELARRRVRQRAGGIRAEALRVELTALIAEEPSARVDYVEFFDPHTFRSVERVTRGSHMAMAVYVGKTRLIDNARL